MYRRSTGHDLIFLPSIAHFRFRRLKRRVFPVNLYLFPCHYLWPYLYLCPHLYLYLFSAFYLSFLFPCFCFSFFSSSCCWYIEFLKVPCSLNPPIAGPIFVRIFIDIFPLMFIILRQRNSVSKDTSFLFPGTKLNLKFNLINNLQTC